MLSLPTSMAPALAASGVGAPAGSLVVPGALGRTATTLTALAWAQTGRRAPGAGVRVETHAQGGRFTSRARAHAMDPQAMIMGGPWTFHHGSSSRLALHVCHAAERLFLKAAALARGALADPSGAAQAALALESAPPPGPGPVGVPPLWVVAAGGAVALPAGGVRPHFRGLALAQLHVATNAVVPCPDCARGPSECVVANGTLPVLACQLVVALRPGAGGEALASQDNYTLDPASQGVVTRGLAALWASGVIMSPEALGLDPASIVKAPVIVSTKLSFAPTAEGAMAALMALPPAELLSYFRGCASYALDVAEGRQGAPAGAHPYPLRARLPPEPPAPAGHPPARAVAAWQESDQLARSLMGRQLGDLMKVRGFAPVGEAGAPAAPALGPAPAPALKRPRPSSAAAGPSPAHWAGAHGLLPPLHPTDLARGLGSVVSASKCRVVMAPTSVNDATTSWDFTYVTPAQIIASMGRGCFVGSNDMTGAFTLMTMHPASRQYLGGSWPASGVQGGRGPDVDFVFTAAYFGPKLNPASFSALSGEVVRLLQRRSRAYAPAGTVLFFVFADDLWVIGATKALCDAGMADCDALCLAVGAPLAAHKRREPTQRGAPLLGLEVDTLALTLRVPDGKRVNIIMLVATTLEAARRRRALPRNFVEKLFGKLRNAADVMRPGIARLWALQEALQAGGASVDCTPAVGDLEWWAAALADPAQACAALLPLVASGALPALVFRSDASSTVGAGAVLNGRIALWCNWTPEAVPDTVASIGTKEDFPKLAVLDRYGPLLRGMVIQQATDNLPNVYSGNRVSTRDPTLRPHLRRYLALAAGYGSLLTLAHLPRELNGHADGVSKARGRQAGGAAVGAFFREV